MGVSSWVFLVGLHQITHPYDPEVIITKKDNAIILLTILIYLSFEAISSKTKHNQGVSLSPNNSGRYESRFVTVKVEKSPSVMLSGMEGSILGVWVAHGEGQVRNFSSLFKLQEQLNCTLTYRKI